MTKRETILQYHVDGAEFCIVAVKDGRFEVRIRDRRVLPDSASFPEASVELTPGLLQELRRALVKIA
jgi:hypothetical protein